MLASAWAAAALCLVGGRRPALAAEAPAGAPALPSASGAAAPTAAAPSAPAASVVISRPADGSLTFLRHITIAGEAPHQATLALSINGAVVGVGVCGVKEPGHFEFVSVPVTPGPQRISVAAQSGNATIESSVTVHVQGTPAKVEIAGEERVAADPATLALYTVRVTDVWGKAAPDGLFVTVSARGGTLETKDADPNTAGVQIRPTGGAGEFWVRPPNTAAVGEVSASTGGLIATRIVSYYQPARPLMLVGRLGTALGVGYRNGPAGPPREPGPGISSDGRFRAFLRGSTESGYLVTGALDSRRDLEDRLFKELDPDRMEPVFGDTSSVFYEAQSRDRMYLQVERDANVYRYGDYVTGLALGGYGAYQRALTGVRLQHTTPRGPLVLFGALTRQSAERTEIRGNGTSGYYFLPQAPVVQGSERVWVEVRDRDRPQVVLRSEFRMRLLDYDIDYQQGSLFFRQPVPGIDPDRNPVFIVVVYESRAAGAQRLITGLRGDTTFGDVGVGTTLVREERSGRDYHLGSVDLSVKLPYGATLLTELAATRALASGSAWRTELLAAPTAALKLRAFASSASGDFENPSTPQFQVGARHHGLDVGYDISSTSAALLQYYRQSGTGTSLTTANGRYRQAFGRASAEAELLHQEFSGGAAGTASNSMLLSGLLRYPLWRVIDLVLQREQSLSGTNLLRPSGTTVGADYRLMPNVRLMAREKLTDRGQSIASIGVASELLRGTSLTSTYEINSVNNGGYNQASIGLNTVLSLAKFVTGNVAFESVRVFGDAPGYQSASLGLEYKPSFPFIGTMKVEGRRAGGRTQTSLSVNGSGRLTDDLALLLRHTQFDDHGAAGALIGATGVPSGRTSIGLAYRPADDRLNLLARYQIRDDESGFLTGQTAARSRIRLGALEGVYEPAAGWQLTGKYAFRTSSASTDGVTTRALTDLWLARVTMDLAPDWNLSGEYRRLHQRQTRSSEYGYGVELGYVLSTDMVVGVGYTFSGEDDPDFTGGSRWARGPYARLGWKFDEDDARSWLTPERRIRAPRLNLRWLDPRQLRGGTRLGHPDPAPEAFRAAAEGGAGR